MKIDIIYAFFLYIFRLTRLRTPLHRRRVIITLSSHILDVGTRRKVICFLRLARAHTAHCLENEINLSYARMNRRIFASAYFIVPAPQ